MSTAKDRSRPPTNKPVTPKLAQNVATFKTVPAPRLAAHLAASSTQSRRPLSATTDPSRIQLAGNVTPPQDSAISSNITPRSSPRSSRKSRTDSIHSAPLVVASAQSDLSRDSSGQQRSEGRLSPTRSPTTKDYVLSPSSLHASSLTLAGALDPPVIEAHSPFFHANDATVPGAQRSNAPKPASSFFYADGRSEERKEYIQDVSARSVEDSHKPALSRGAPFVSPRPTNGATSPSTNTPSPIAAHAFPGNAFKTASPPKERIHLSYRKGVSQIMPPSSRPLSTASPQQSPLSSDNVSKRRQSSIDTISDLGEWPRSSADTPSQRSAQHVDVATSPRPQDASDAMRSPHVKQSEASFFPAMPWSQPAPLLSPTLRTVAGVDQSGSETPGAAEARRERKLLDLEISNSSLLAINRSLEREVRKQKAEIRRFRRLTYSSAALSNSQSRSTSLFSESTDMENLLSEEEEEDMDNEMDEKEDDSRGESDEEEEIHEEDSESLPGPRTRRSDARRLRLDLRRHKELLVDSQKMNFSLQRCLGLSEQMIGEAQRALQEEVRVSEIKWGGRVLHADELIDRDCEGLASNGLNITPSKEGFQWTPDVDPTDGDSGVDVGMLSIELGDQTDRFQLQQSMDRLTQSTT